MVEAFREQGKACGGGGRGFEGKWGGLPGAFSALRGCCSGGEGKQSRGPSRGQAGGRAWAGGSGQGLTAKTKGFLTTGFRHKRLTLSPRP